MTENEKKTAPAQPEPAAKSLLGRQLVVAAVGIVLCIGAAVTVGVVAFPDATSEQMTGPPPTERIQFPVPQVLVNLSGGGGRRLLQATLSLDLATADVAKATATFNELLPKVQDQLIKVLSSFTEADLDGRTAKESVQTRIKDHLNRGLFQDAGVVVENIYFTEFVVQ